MKIKKIFAGIMALNMAAAMGTGAFAATLTETTDGSKASVASLPESSGQMTVLVAKIDASSVTVDSETGAATVSNPTITDETIIYIDQDAYASGMFKDMGLKTTLNEGDYFLVRVGGENLTSIHEEIYKVVKEGGVVKIADVTGDGKVNVDDMNAMIAYIQNNLSHPNYSIGSDINGTETKLGDVTGDKKVNVDDMNAFIAYIQNNLSHPTYDFDATAQ